MKVIKRNGSEVEFDKEKIRIAIFKANKEVTDIDSLSDDKINYIVDCVEADLSGFNRAINVEEIQEFVETELMVNRAYEVAKKYIRYRYKRTLSRQKNTIDDAILSLIEQDNEEIKQENSNKNPTIVSTQRDYMAGEVSKDLANRLLLPKDVVEADAEGIIHFHDKDYFLQRLHNCDLINLDDMLQNGTVISGTMIEKPHSFSTACNIATQIIAQVASSQYGGQSITLAALAPFVDVSRKKIKKQVEEEISIILESISDAGDFDYNATLNRITEERVKEEVKRGVQTIQYQVVTLQTTNGQAPFITVYMDINEAPEGQEREDLALIIEEVLKQRIHGVKNEKGVWVTNAFPKLIYALDDNNITPDGEYFYLTELAAKCTAKRMVPDYISKKMMRELKNGDTYTCINKTCA